MTAQAEGHADGSVRVKKEARLLAQEGFVRAGPLGVRGAKLGRALNTVILSSSVFGALLYARPVVNVY